MSGTPVIFNVAYTPYKLKKGSTEKEIKAHAEKRAYYDFTGDTNYLRYMTTEGKLTGNESKKFTMLDYLQKSTGVFNGDGMISRDELKEMKRRLKENKGNIWSGFVSFDEENSGKIDTPEKCIALIRKTFNEFFRDMGLDPREVDLICALHLDRPSHLHFHFEFYEKRPWLKNKRAAGYKYRSKGKVPIKAIDNMVERLTSYTIDDELKKRSDEARSALYKRKDFSEALCRDVATKKMKELAEKIPPTASFQYGKKDMAMYRREIDGIVEAVAMVDEDVCAADSAFRAELMRKETALKSIMGKYYAKRMKDDGIFKEEMTNASEFFGLKHIRTIDRLEWDYRRRLGNIVLKKVKYIQENTYKYNRTKKRKANDKSIKRHIAVSDNKIGRELSNFFGSVFDLFLPETQAYSNRLREIEREMKEEKEKEEREAAAKNNYYYNSR